MAETYSSILLFPETWIRRLWGSLLNLKNTTSLAFQEIFERLVLFASSTVFICFYSFALFIYQEITPTTPTTSSALAAAATDLDLEMGGRIASSLGALFSTLSFPANQTSPPPIHPRSSCYLWNNSKKTKKW